MLLSPATPVTPLIGVVVLNGARLTATFPVADARFVEVVKRRRLAWDAARREWTRTIDPVLHGAPLERAAELTLALLGAGFVVETSDAIAERARLGDIAPEHRRWVRRVKEEARVYFEWERDVDLYPQLKRLPGARYDGMLTVPADAWREIRDAADRLGFRISPKAEEVLTAAQQRYEAAVLVIPAAAPRVPVTPAPAPAPTTFDIHPELRDADLDDDD